ncbi:uncharacterized protein LOC119984286 [Tripterygium wilfordii]|uniref:uncharacterized protein LOC119984286 n=1 Tax=Tripterygium wilfordii TaxID=458696 RepID=UPI0018F83B83|nr:uncharacterized protein LOC119984286 [Tripterygium wilfordii]
MTTSLESCLTEKEDSGSKEMDLDCCWNDAAQTYSGDSNLGGGGEEDGEEEEEGTDIVALDFNFLDNVGSSYYYSPFEIAEEIEEPVEPEYCGDEPSMLRAAMKRMKYERKFSASLYAFNGIPECLKLRLASQNVKGRARSDHSTKLQKACDDYKEEERNANEDNTEVMKKQEERGGSNSNIRTSFQRNLASTYTLLSDGIKQGFKMDSHHMHSKYSASSTEKIIETKKMKDGNFTFIPPTYHHITCRMESPNENNVESSLTSANYCF